MQSKFSYLHVQFFKIKMYSAYLPYFRLRMTLSPYANVSIKVCMHVEFVFCKSKKIVSICFPGIRDIENLLVAWV